jgi:hypothetical protein
MKSEIRNPTAERGPKSDGRKETGSRRPHFRHLGFGILSGFGFRVSGPAFVWLAAGAALSLAVVLGVRAQHSGRATDFTTTEYYEPPHQQQIKSVLSGAEALPQSGGLLIIKQLKLRTFDLDGKLEMIVTAPECIYDTMGGTARSAGPLQLQNGDGKFHVEGEGFLWRQTNFFLTISNKVHTVIENGAKMNIKP